MATCKETDANRQYNERPGQRTHPTERLSNGVSRYVVGRGTGRHAAHSVTVPRHSIKHPGYPIRNVSDNRNNYKENYNAGGGRAHESTMAVTSSGASHRERSAPDRLSILKLTLSRNPNGSTSQLRPPPPTWKSRSMEDQIPNQRANSAGRKVHFGCRVSQLTRAGRHFRVRLSQPGLPDQGGFMVRVTETGPNPPSAIIDL